MTNVAVLDIGKTNAKLALVDAENRTEIAVLTRPNQSLSGPPYRHFDTENLWSFFCDALQSMAHSHRIDALSVTTHGASVVLLEKDGSLAAPVFDYEEVGPDSVADTYDRLRPDFAETGSPRLPMGLNVGAQLHWQLQKDPGLAQRVAHVLTYPQYWGYRLTGRIASDVSSLGCHTDLWNPWRSEPTPLLDRLGLEGKLAPSMRPFDELGSLSPELAIALGLEQSVPVAVGIHDSNASLLPHLIDRTAPFSVVSTGTWVVCFAIGPAAVTLDAGRDTLVNVSAFGHPVPSARFMGGREYELVCGVPGTSSDPDRAAVDRVLEKALMVLPSFVPGSGPFPGRKAIWSPEKPTDAASLHVAMSYYLALVTAESLRLIGALGPIVVEGPFRSNPQFLDMLSAATGRVVEVAASRTGTSVGAALLCLPEAVRQKSVRPSAEIWRVSREPQLAAYAEAWRKRVG